MRFYNFTTIKIAKLKRVTKNIEIIALSHMVDFAVIIGICIANS